MPASRLKALFSMLRRHYFRDFGVFVRDNSLDSVILSPTHVTYARLTVERVYENPVDEPPLGVLDLEDILKVLTSIKSDTPLIYDFSKRNGEIRYEYM